MNRFSGKASPSMLLPDLSSRLVQAELMDSPEVDEGSHRIALRALARINTLSLAAGKIWKVVQALAHGRESPLRILDVACGGGDVALSLKRRGNKAGIDLQVNACDLHPFAVDFATRRARGAGLEVRFFRHDAGEGELPGGFDLVCSSLFLHHLSEEGAVAFLGRLNAAGRIIFVQDLLRTRLGYLMAVATTKVITRSPVVHVDGPRSVRAAFSLSEARELARAAGVEGPSIERCWPERFSMTWEGA
jgi:2-polyprenyl-3-methyl-5-hydroxy-6-metoxy-1,4-benzoquinol methylase